MAEFNARASRAKRPCPLWIDAFQRDTQHLEADEVGAYLLILMAMWTRESCDFPDDDTRLARVSRVSIRLWKSRIGPTLRAFFRTDGGMLVSKRLREEATYVERQVENQSDRKVSNKPHKPLKSLSPTPTADVSADQPRHHPSQQPNNPTKNKKEPPPLPPPPSTDPARDTAAAAEGHDSFFANVVSAAGYNPSDVLPTHWMPPRAEIEVLGWLDLPGMTEALAIQHVRISTAAKGRSRGPLAFRDGLRALSATLVAPPIPPPERAANVVPLAPFDLEAFKRNNPGLA